MIRNVVMQILHLMPVLSASILALDSAWFFCFDSFIFLALLRSRLAADFCPFPPPMTYVRTSAAAAAAAASARLNGFWWALVQLGGC